MDWLLDNWQLIASAGLALANFLLTLLVHRSSGKRISKLEDTNGDGVPDQIEELIQINKDLLEKLKNEKTPRP